MDPTPDFERCPSEQVRDHIDMLPTGAEVIGPDPCPRRRSINGNRTTKGDDWERHSHVNSYERGQMHPSFSILG